MSQTVSPTNVIQIAPDIYRISTFISEFNLQFNQFLVDDEEPLLFHTGMRGLFPHVIKGVGQVLDPASIRWIAFSHFEADECGALREWQQLAPDAVAACSLVAKIVNVDDVVAARPARPLADGERFSTGRKTFRFFQTPQVPHAWDAGLLFEETTETLLCSDLLQQNGERPAITEEDVVPLFRRALLEFQGGPLADYLPYTPHTEPTLQRLAGLKPRVLATMHGSTFTGDGERALLDLAAVMREVLGELPCESAKG